MSIIKKNLNPAPSKLKTFRRNKGLSQELLAEISGISLRTIQRIEKGLSEGSAFTLKSLARALEIETKELIAQESSNQPLSAENKDALKLLNLSALCVVLIPFSNLILPAILFWKNRQQEVVNKYGRRILSFHLLWILLTLVLMLVVPMLLQLFFSSLRGAGMPLALPVYFVSVLFNVYVTIRIALAIDDQLDVLEKIPNVL